MELTIKLNLPLDFQHLCEIFDFAPEKVIQAFADQVSFPVFHSQLNSPHRWATFFFLDYMDAANGEVADKWEIHKPFLDKIAASITKDEGKSEVTCRNVMGEWHRFVLHQRAEDLLKKYKEKK